MQVGVRLPEPANAGATLLHLTGSTGALRGAAARTRPRRGWRLTRRRPARARRHAAAGGRPKRTIYAALGPAAASRRRSATATRRSRARAAASCRALVARGDIRGDLHMHSTWSDGRDSIEAMVQACRALGYEYIAITDHSPSSAAVAQPDGRRREAAGRRDRRAARALSAASRSCTAARSTSCRMAGSTFPIAILERFDIVLASLHDRAGHAPGPAAAALRRGACSTRSCTLITHPTNRLVPHRRGYDLDYDRLFAAGGRAPAPRSKSTARRRISTSTARSRAGPSPPARPSAIDSDCHRAEMLGAPDGPRDRRPRAAAGSSRATC